MKLVNINDVNGFFDMIGECRGKVELVSPEGDRINLKSKLSQYVAMAEIFSNGYIRELEIVAYDHEDVSRIVKYMMENK